ncbi:BON domain-containing protein [Mycobacterium sp. KBS0706]|jgi:osmotically-inducible protein OsmY|uniref:BON domain-containing protein n=1 Tax=Mycobacterium sp. KBS0706 TaxID=2578109 RepID=UPI00110F9E04|nr:BON domain-containing protein [Mycobacterium sp. KBS0706]TSD85492.1 BON domain-containing protein [Mycobacterium sp. KBS0706]
MTGKNEDLRRNVLNELAWDPTFDATHIGVAADNGVVTLTGHVTTYAEKLAAERAAQRVTGVRGIAEEIEVRPPYAKKTKDDEIAERAVRILQWDVSVPTGRISVKVEKGWVTLSGTVDWDYQRGAAAADIQKLSGVMGLINLIKVQPAVRATDVKHKIEEAFRRNAALDAGEIRVSAVDGTITLSGRVRNWAERNTAERAAWSAPGVTAVEDHLLVG